MFDAIEPLVNAIEALVNATKPLIKILNEFLIHFASDCRKLYRSAVLVNETRGIVKR